LAGLVAKWVNDQGLTSNG